MSLATDNKLERLFYPKNIAVIGASPKSGAFLFGGNGFILGSIKLNFQGGIYPVHPSAERILGYKSYKNILEIPEDIDLAIFSVPRSVVLSVMRDCVKKRVKFVHIFTAGFSETDRKENTEIEKELLSIAHKGGIRILGPNCMGIYCPEGGLSWSNDFSRKPGTIGFVSQSGQLATQFIEQCKHHGLRISKTISFGNASDLQCHDFINYLAQDEKTKVIGSYVEGMKSGRSFFEAAKGVTLTKPLVVWKGGQTEGGSRATQSHTAAIAGSPQIWQSLCKQTGIISVNSIDEMVFTISALQKTILPKGRNAAILGGAGGGSVTMTDAAEREGLKVPQLSADTIKSLEEFIPIEGSSVKNPLDIMPALFNEDHFKEVFALLRYDPNIDVIIFTQQMDTIYGIGGRRLLDAFIALTLEVIVNLNKPIFIILQRSLTLEGEALRQEALGKYNRANIPTFESFQSAFRTVYNMNQYQNFLSSRR
ncbi:MAG: CoA-binding protein [Spirochaetota bacterium]|nr:CoA-binding protein [Spirochaetota bacterium]